MVAHPAAPSQWRTHLVGELKGGPMRQRIFLSLVAAALLSVVLAAPTLGAKPTREVISLDDPDAEAEFSTFISEACGIPIAVDFEGTVTVHVFTNRHGEFTREIDKYWIRDTFTNTATGATILLRDVGPDIIGFNRDGELILAIVGRSITGSGVIGRTVISLDTGEVLHQSGRDVGSFVDQVCDALT